MVMTNAEKFDSWRQRHLGKEGDRSRIQTYVKAHLGSQLRVHATMQDMTITEAIEHMIENIHNIDWPIASKAKLITILNEDDATKLLAIINEDDIAFIAPAADKGGRVGLWFWEVFAVDDKPRQKPAGTLSPGEGPGGTAPGVDWLTGGLLAKGAGGGHADD